MHGEDRPAIAADSSANRPTLRVVPPVEPPVNDVGRANRLARVILRERSHLYIGDEGGWRRWTGACWEHDHARSVYRLAARLAGDWDGDCADPTDEVVVRAARRLREKGLTRAAVNAAVELAIAYPGVTCLLSELDAHPYLLNTADGTVNLRNGKVAAHNPDDRLTLCTPYGYDPSLPSPIWDKFIADTFEGDEELSQYMQRVLGAAVCGVLREQKLFCAFGSGRNGKSVLMGTVQAILGRYATTLDSSLIASRRAQGSNEVDYKAAALRGKRLAISYETGAGASLDEATVKRLSSDDEIPARSPYGRPFVFTPSHTLILVTNHRPVVPSQDDGTWRRLVLIPFAHQVPDDQVDEDLKPKLLAEAPAILAWIVQGAVDYLRVGLGTCDAVAEASAAYRTDCDILGRFIEDCCVIGSSNRVNQADFRIAWEDWHAAHGSKPWTLRILKEALMERGVLARRGGEVKSNGVRWLVGVGFSSEFEAAYVGRHGHWQSVQGAGSRDGDGQRDGR
jgi:putative DNA primase/helicase